MTGSRKKTEIRAVIDTNIFVPALAYRDTEVRLYNLLLRKCWKVVISEQIVEEYERVLRKFGQRPAVVQLELNKLHVSNKYRSCTTTLDEIEQIGDDLSPRKDRHIIAPCLKRCANVLLTCDGGIHERRQRILRQCGARVLSMDDAEAELNVLDDCRPDG